MVFSRHPLSKAIRLVRWAACIALIQACGHAPDQSRADPDPPAEESIHYGVVPDAEPSPHRLVHELTWNTEGVAFSDDGSSWSVTNNLGYSVEVSMGYIVSFGVQLVPCKNEPEPTASVSTRLWRGVKKLFSLPIAHAGHAEMSVDPSAMPSPYTEDLVTLQDVEAATVTVQNHVYCHSHYLIARGTTHSRSLPDEPNMVGLSLYLQGTYRAPGGPSTTDFEVETDSAYGALFSLHLPEGEALSIDSSYWGARVQVERKLASVFDDIDFAVTDERHMTYQILKTLVGDTTVTVTPSQTAVPIP